MMKDHSENRFRQMLVKLQEKRFRLTPQRMEIVRILAKNRDHPTVEDIHAAVYAQFPTTSLATTYKTVALLRDVGEVTEMGFAEGGNRYDGYNPNPHPHLICLVCKKILDLTIPVLDRMMEGVAKQMDEVAKQGDFQITTHRMDFFGICPDCRYNRAS